MPPIDGWDSYKTNRPHFSPGPSDFPSLKSRVHLAVFDAGARYCLSCWGLTNAHVREETSQQEALFVGAAAEGE